MCTASIRLWRSRSGLRQTMRGGRCAVILSCYRLHILLSPGDVRREEVPGPFTWWIGFQVRLESVFFFLVFANQDASVVTEAAAGIGPFARVAAHALAAAVDERRAVAQPRAVLRRQYVKPQRHTHAAAGAAQCGSARDGRWGEHRRCHGLCRRRSRRATGAAVHHTICEARHAASYE